MINAVSNTPNNASSTGVNGASASPMPPVPPTATIPTPPGMGFAPTNVPKEEPTSIAKPIANTEPSATQPANAVPPVVPPPPIDPTAPKFPDPSMAPPPAGSSVPPRSGLNKKKISAKLIIGAVLLFLLVLGSGVGLYLTQRSQELRQQASGPYDCTPWVCGNVTESNCATQQLFNSTWCDGQARWKWQAAGNSGSCGGNPSSPASSGCGTGSGMCPDNSGPAVWCATFDCSDTGDVNGDGECTSADGVQAQIREGINCPQPRLCGQVDIYRAGPSGQNWQAFCGTTYHNLDNCGTGGGGSSPSPSPSPSAVVSGSIACLDITGTIKTTPVTNADTPLTFDITSSGGTAVTKVELVYHGNFEGPGWGAGWTGLIDPTPTDGTFSGTKSFNQMVAELVATGHNREQLLSQGIQYYANVYGPQGFCTGNGTWSIGGKLCTVNPLCKGTLTLATTTTSPSPSPSTSPTPPVEPGVAYCEWKRAYTNFAGKTDASLLSSSETAGSTQLTVKPGQEFIYRLRVTAEGSLPVNEAITVEDVLPQQLTFVADPGNTAGLNYEAASRKVTLKLSGLAAGEVKIIEFKVKVNDDVQAGVIANSASVSMESIATNDRECLTTVEVVLDPVVTTYSCNSTCTTDAQCQGVNSEYVCAVEEGNKCRLDSNRTSASCEPKPATYACNSKCETNEQCKTANANYICSSDKVCRLASAPEQSNCTNPAQPTPPPAVGCNETCSTNADCSNSDHICYTTPDGSNKCRLANYLNSTTCTAPSSQSTTTTATTTQQPVLPAELPETGPAGWMSWLKAGLVTLGVGAVLLLLL